MGEDLRVQTDMKKIALITDSWNQYFVYAWPAGIMQRLNESEEMVNLHIFNSFGNWSRDIRFCLGEYNIYRLPQLEQYDGIILDLNNIAMPQIVEDTVNRVRKAGVPVLSISNSIPGFYYAGIDNYSAMKEMIAHLHQVHGCQKFWFILGPPENFENRRRELALRDYLREQKLAYSESDFYYESYEYECGVRGFEQLLMTHREIPQAVICANDNIAVGVCETAASHGYRVPEDFCVTGFDNFDKASHYLPRISTVSHVREEIGYLCGDVLLRLWAGEEVPQFNYTGTGSIFWESCGCSSGEPGGDREYLRERMLYEIETDKFDFNVQSLKHDLMQCSTVEDMMYCIPKAVPSMRCDAMYLVLDERMNYDRKQAATELMNPRLFTAEEFCTEGYPQQMRIKFAYENGKKVDLSHVEPEDVFSRITDGGKGTDYLFLPLHFEDQTVGYFVLQNAVYLMERQYLFSVMNALNMALENLHKNEKLEYMNQILSQLYIVDSMTGLYNRRGCQQLIEGFVEELHQAGERALMLFIDLDRLKTINDTLGHEYGDRAITTVAGLIRSHCSKDCMGARMGGDEFLMVQKYLSEEETEKLKTAIGEELQECILQIRFPLQFGVSIGEVVTDPQSERGFHDYVKEADELMYQEKTRKRADRSHSQNDRFG